MALAPRGIVFPWTLAAEYAADFDDDASYVGRIAATPGYRGWFRSVQDEITLVGGLVDTIADAGNNGTTIFASSSGPSRAQLLAEGLRVPRAGVNIPIVRSIGGTSAPYRYTGTFDANLACTFVMLFKLRAWPTDVSIESVIGVAENASNRLYVHVIGNDPDVLRFQASGTDGFVKLPMVLNEWTLVIASFTPGSPNTIRLEVNGVRAEATWSGTPTNGTVAPVVAGYTYTGAASAKEIDWSDAILFQSDLFLNPDALALVKGYFRDLHALG